MSEKMTLKEYRREIGKQPDLPGTRSRTNSGGRGKNFESEIAKTNAFYELNGLAFVVQNERVWVNCPHWQRQSMLDKQIRFLTAMTDNNVPMMSKKSKPDFDGVIRGGRQVCFDCKETKGKSLPLANIEAHQIEYLAKCENLGALAGLLIFFSDLSEVYFVPASVIKEMHDRIKRGEKCPKSISVKMANESGMRIVRKENFCDWLMAAERF